MTTTTRRRARTVRADNPPRPFAAPPLPPADADAEPFTLSAARPVRPAFNPDARPADLPGQTKLFRL